MTASAVVALLVAACSNDDDSTAPAPTATAESEAARGPVRPVERNVEIAVVTHGQAGDPFWAIVKNGVDQAAREMGVTVSYHAPDVYEPGRMRESIDIAVANRPDGLVVSIPDADVLAPALERAVAAGIPIVAINSGESVYRRLGALLYVGEPEYAPAFAAGRRMAAAGARNAICVHHQAGTAALDERCRGFAAGLAKTGGRARIVTVKLQEQEDAERRISDAVSSGAVDGVLTLGPAGAAPALAALRATERLGKIVFATFDLGPEVLRAVRAGHIAFAIDQQPFLQGYLPIVLLTQYELYGVLPAIGSIIPTGPNFVTRRDAERVIRLSEAGIR
jgi:simple sugar transport system substrate-binding protein